MSPDDLGGGTLTDPASVRISRATGLDAPALRDLHATTWADTYAGLLPPDYYQRRLALHRTRRWDTIIADQETKGGGVLVARTGTGTGTGTGLAGLCQYGPSEDGDDRGEAGGEIHRLYVHPAAQRQGVGSALLTEAVDRLTRPGVSSLTLWVLEADPRARGFYERLGWRTDGARRFDGATDIRYRLRVS